MHPCAIRPCAQVSHAWPSKPGGARPAHCQPRFPGRMDFSGWAGHVSRIPDIRLHRPSSQSRWTTFVPEVGAVCISWGHLFPNELNAADVLVLGEVCCQRGCCTRGVDLVQHRAHWCRVSIPSRVPRLFTSVTSASPSLATSPADRLESDLALLVSQGIPSGQTCQCTAQITSRGQSQGTSCPSWSPRPSALPFR